MALLLPNSVFIHIPKTGGLWVRGAIRRAGIPAVEMPCTWHDGIDADWMCGKRGERLESRHMCMHSALHDIDPKGRLTFAFVRHPLSFYRSYWSYKMVHGWEVAGGHDRKLQSDTFEEFVRNCIRQIGENRSGYVASVYEWFLDNGKKTVDFVGRQESLADDLVKALRMAGESFDEEALRTTPAINASKNEYRDKAVYSPELLALVLEKDDAAIRRFGYDLLPPGNVASIVQARTLSPQPMKTGVFVGRFQPFHEGHKRCVEKILTECDRCIILLRDTESSDKNPFDLQKRTAFIRAQFPDEERVLIQSVQDPGCDLTVYIGRDVGYDLIRLDASTEAISATDIRKKLYAESVAA